MSSVEIESLRPCRAFKGLSDVQLRRIAAELTWHDLQPMEQGKSPGAPVEALHTVTRGRLRMYQFDGQRHRFVGYANLGETIGQASLLSTEIDRHSTYVADLPSRVAALDRDTALQFVAEYPRFRENLFATFGRRMRSVVAGDRFRRNPRVVGIVGRAPKSQQLLHLLARRFQQIGERVHIFTDRTEHRFAEAQTTTLALAPELRRGIHERLGKNDRVLVELTQVSSDSVKRLFEECDEVLWCCNNERPDRESEIHLSEMVESNPLMESRVVCVQITSDDRSVGRREPCCSALNHRDFIIPIGAESTEPPRQQRAALDRIVRHLRGVKIGLALGGGGARGLSHLGVLKALDRAGITFDVMGGTSAGAMIGLGYAAGMTPDALIETFTKELTPPDLFEQIPGGRRLFLFTKFLQQAWEEMLRDHYGDWTFEQLPIPFSVVSTDLVAGEELVRDSGDIVQAILESINVPVMSEPILNDGKVLVDGGVLNNLPIELLADQGAEFVVGVDASKEIPNHFAGNFSHMKTSEMESPGRLETAIRVMEVSRRGIAQMQMSLADVVIEPDTSAFDFADFTCAAQIAETGEQAAEQQLPQIKRSYEHLMNHH